MSERPRSPDEYMQENRKLWNEWTPIHRDSEFYDVESFRKGAIRLHALEQAELGDVRGKSLLHLQCHFGLDTLSWARLGATVTGADYAEVAIDLARSLAAECGIDARFVCANVYDLPAALTGQFDIVYTSYGVLGWLPELAPWARVIAHFLRPGGTLYMAEGHPFAQVFADRDELAELRIGYPYFPEPGEPITLDVQGSYADPDAHVSHPHEYSWNHTMGEIINSLVSAGLAIEFLHEHPFCVWQMFPFMQKDASGYWRLTGQRHEIPLMFSLKARRPGP